MTPIVLFPATQKKDKLENEREEESEGEKKGERKRCEGRNEGIPGDPFSFSGCSVK